MRSLAQLGTGLLVTICVLYVGAWFTGGSFNNSDVCLRCGAERNTRRVLWIPFSEVRATPLSTYLSSHGRPADEGHRWLMVAGGGGPVRCALGSGRRLLRSVHSKEIPGILETIRTHRGDAETEKWVNRLLDPTKERAHEAYLDISMLAYPGTGFDSAYATAVEEYDLWLSDPAH